MPNKEQKMRKIMALIAGLFISLGLMTGAAQAAPLVGSVNAGDDGGLTATSPWSNGLFDAALGWKVYETAAGWVYDYGIFVPAKKLSHVIIEVSETFTAANILQGTTDGWELGYWGDEGNSNPGIPEILYGLKFDSNNFLDAFKIVTDRAPMWGSVYMKDGKFFGHDVYAFNDNFGGRSEGSIYGQAPDGFILVPNTVTSQVPEPGSLALLSLGLVGAGFTMNRRSKMVLRTAQT